MYFKRPMCVLCLCFVFLFLIFARLFPPKEAAKRFSESIASKEVTVYGRLYKLEHKNYSTVLYLRDISLLSGNTGESALVQASGSGEKVLSCEGLLAYLADSKEEASLHIGCFLLLRGEYSPFDEAQNAGNFDAKQYYAIRRIYGRVKKARIQRVSEDYSKIGDMLFRVKERTKGVFFDYLDEAEAGTLT
ncbi:MAG: DUF4131 domain-containing protein, partial [Lachnospiraceae bacterium]|nr:DUF4131 domain-containing protein [Lachnospiraceae bacterium]